MSSEDELYAIYESSQKAKGLPVMSKEELFAKLGNPREEMITLLLRLFQQPSEYDYFLPIVT